ncbi:hypothetical protein KZ829_17060 [Actinoplanes hulinensis]|uniref:Uncharacterized protein n=1 Tax=Actinoplanes hulinensis TaxID=1144547 RepID=A0ABS7B378_9ACTN|nr:hypothetical protein [Actinoplanes hulinensis]MBW6435450.1 hypothetical protein [Actinoplanes hulinensis]
MLTTDVSNGESPSTRSKKPDGCSSRSTSQGTERSATGATAATLSGAPPPNPRRPPRGHAMREHISSVIEALRAIDYLGS